MALSAVSSSSGMAKKSGQLVLKNKLRVLVVDDNTLQRRIMIMLLKAITEVETQEAENGKEAVELFAAGETFDLVLMDMEMPVMTGPEATRKLRGMGMKAKVAAITGNDSASAKREFLDAGADDFFVKPMGRAQLVELLREVDDKLQGSTV